MHRIILSLLTAAIICSSCETIDVNQIIENEEDGCEVVFSMDGYIITDFSNQSDTQSNMPTRAMRKAPAKDLGTVLNLAVFKGAEKVKTINQKSTDSGFGTIKTILPPGDYQVVVLLHSCSGNATISAADKITFPNNKVTDTFSCYSDITIDKDETISMTLSRRVAMFRLVIEEEIPDEVCSMKFYYTGGSSTINGKTGFGCVNSKQTEIREVASHATGQAFDVFTLPHDVTGTLTMTVTAQDSNGGEYSVTRYEKVPVEVNKITYCRRAFFSAGDASQSAGFTITGNGEWKGNIEY